MMKLWKKPSEKMDEEKKKALEYTRRQVELRGDKNDAPTPLKSFDSLGGNASENWTLLRVLPFIMEDFVEDKEDEMWCLYLQMKEIVELVTAPKISLQQVLYLKLLIKEYLEDLAGLLPDQLVL
ncbi:NADH-quinone oxidoreductase subunit N [Frankliniella fusca]|uniref:NADH-quinone oxidoreductase subunit N n=1 Tax=Frankliniella fusca TaxID=407009 RepID=A0AAE1LC93_9NEOP|nr:NADH-quinone oxidoreductase subunit N [Frankliniella fusca]